MPFPVNPLLQAVESPPIAEAMGWVEGLSGNRALINLCQAVPSYPPAQELQHHVAQAAKNHETSLYTDISGLMDLRSELADHMSHDYGGDISRSEVLISAGCNQAYCLAILALARGGDNVILPAPYYFNHHMWLSMLGIEGRIISALSGPGAVPSVADAARQIDARTRAIVLVTPNNPTGAIFPKEVVSQFFALAQAKNIALIIDETYKDFRSDAAPPHDLFQRSDWRGTLVQLYSFSKAFSLTGYRVGSLIAQARFISEIEKIMDTISISAPRISQYAALFALRSLAAWKNEKAAMMAERLQSLRDAFSRAGLKYDLVSSGAYFAYVRHPFETRSAKSVARILAREHQLLCLPGSMFGPGQERYLRLAFANVEAQVMPEVVDRLMECQ